MSSEKCRIFIVRHGETLFNKLDRIQGWADSPLTEFGESKIQTIADTLSRYNFCYAYTSDSRRAVKTCDIILAKQTHPVQQTQTKILREWYYGSNEGMTKKAFIAKIAAKVPQYDKSSRLQENFSFKDFSKVVQQIDDMNSPDNFSTIRRKLNDYFRKIAEKHSENGENNILVVSHGLSILTFLSRINDQITFQTPLKNGAVIVLEYSNNEFSLVNDDLFF